MSCTHLGGSLWRFRACGGDKAEARRHPEVSKWMPACVPGSTYGQLLALKKIPDPYWGRNELDVQWVDRLDWEFARTVEASEADCACLRQELIFEGLDTVAVVLLNGREVGRGVNMFRRLVCDVRGILRPGTNELSVRFASPTAYSAAQAEAHPEHIVSISPALRGNREFTWQTGERRWTNRPWIRKAQCHFGWDWGVCLPTQGVWMPCRLECADVPRLEAITVAQRHVGPAGAPRRVELTIGLRLAHAADAEGTVVVACGGREARVPARVRRGTGLAAATITIDSPKLWWPNGYGKQPLYEIRACWEGGGEPVRRRVGLRTVKLVTKADETPVGRPAESMAFRVNGRVLYAKGGDWIPPDQFVERCTPSVYRHLLGSMCEAHMNMVRVWGGGWYELDAFYDACDELGLLVWQDFMMACALFPDTEAFIGEVVAEARDQVRRLQHRACVALWCGDNENLSGVNHWWKDPRDPAAIRRGYARMMRSLREVVGGEDPTRRFWVSSPSNGWIDADSESPDRGDVHYWSVWHGRQPFSNYLTVYPRFVSEFGFQSFAEPRTMRACVPADGLNPSSRHMEHHQRCGEGNQLIANALARELPLPKDFDAYCWESQINQADAIRTAVEHWRRLKPWCAGTLFWQINDLWPVASWSSIDWHGRWKALHHAAARFYAPLLVSCVHDRDSGTLSVWATSDLDRALALRGRLVAMTWDGRIIGRVALKADLAADASVEVARVDTARLLKARLAPWDVCIFAELAGGGRRGASYATLAPWKHIDLPRPNLSKEIVAGKKGLELRLSTDKIAAFVHADIVGTESHFDGSFDVLRPGRVYRWRLVEHRHRGQKPITSAQAKKGLRVFSLYDLALRERAEETFPCGH